MPKSGYQVAFITNQLLTFGLTLEMYYGKDFLAEITASLKDSAAARTNRIPVGASSQSTGTQR